MSGPDCFEDGASAPWSSERLAAVRAGHGVVLLEDASARPVLLSTTADVRTFLRARLLPAESAPGEAAAGGTRPGRGKADLRGIVARARVARAGSRFEAEWLYLGAARAMMPREYRALMDRWRAWFVQVDLGERIPRLRKLDLASEAAASGAGVVLLGPMRDKEAAGRYMERLTDVFDLCREERLLMQAPHAMACPYKEMGRCPAPCDGSESIESYRARVAEAARFGAAPIEREVERIEAQMAQAAAELRFEEAAGLRRVLERVSALRGRSGAAFAHVGDLRESRWVIVGRSEREEWARVFVCAVGLLEAVADVPARAGEGALAEAARAIDVRLASCRPAADEPLSLERRDGLALLCRWLNFGQKRRLVEMRRVGDDGLTARDLGAMIRAALKPAPAATTGEEPPMELEGALG
jgi:DNA polymerase-3 subunit epsilon